ncbi:hypothetical protein SAMN05216559_3558 [Halomicrobium zhouii]|uniref:Uncharacterized protein n=1 Tax=Halomicrobium zhouii TaxID=767519 RepID=A0A1I6M1T0_9EURY|nr:hypothetical protein [Halomicrobium zhouii]SFS09666.1 hypothetical protein SAMN05216559_3558 [Halomicrobium zhouii]
MARLRGLVESRSLNAAVTWTLVGVLVAGTLASLAVGDLLWAVFGATVVAVALVPTVVMRDASVLVAWEPLALAAVPLVAQWVGLFVTPLTYLSVAALALLVAVEIDSFSTAEMPPWFAVLFVVLTTLTVAGLWGILQYFSDVLLETSFLAGRVALMWELVGATGAGVAAGVLFHLYFQRYGSIGGSSAEVGGS